VLWISKAVFVLLQARCQVNHFECITQMMIFPCVHGLSRARCMLMVLLLLGIRQVMIYWDANRQHQLNKANSRMPQLERANGINQAFELACSRILLWI